MKIQLPKSKAQAALFAIAVWSALLTPVAGHSKEGEVLIDDFTNDPESRWEFVADHVMGGKSSGEISFGVSGEVSFMHLEGNVTTVNNGGFIQARRNVDKKSDIGEAGLSVRARGNSEEYFIHIKTNSTRWPSQYYQCSFLAREDWSTEDLKFDECKRSGNRVPKVLKPEKIKSIAVVAFGREHRVALYVDWISAF